jgi:heat shock protein HslJ
MNAKPLPLLLFTFTLIACSAGAPPTTRPSGSPAPGTPAPTGTAPAPTAPIAPTPTGPTPTGPTPAGVERRDFLSVSVVVDGQPRALVPNTVIRIGFRDGRISASAGCNSFGGAYRIDGDRLIIDGGSMTEMGCDAPRHGQDDWLFGLLEADPQIALDGDNLVLTAADGNTVITLLDREVAEPDLPLEGATWTLTSIVTGDVASSVPAGVVATITFNADGSVAINPGCNSVGGRYAIDGDTIAFTDLITTDMACQGPAGDVEAAVMSILTADPISLGVQSNSLTLAALGNGLVLTGTNASDV